ncbi:hypothetical protein AK830_g4359 [Neonectria ditissima]|uniref:Uncharacterized protein n=1 Tax=Neonectria ditissima TaxID=78410 RepID=A0A0P7BLL6_9HYPO|nr:hypothetical protein AK830_g4359 [Neonectria ditissima]
MKSTLSASVGLLIAAATLSEAVTLKHYAFPDCSGGYGQCTNVWPRQCCTVGVPIFGMGSSVKFISLPPMGFGYIFEAGTMAQPGQPATGCNGVSTGVAFSLDQCVNGRGAFSVSGSEWDAIAKEECDPCEGKLGTIELGVDISIGTKYISGISKRAVPEVKAHMAFEDGAEGCQLADRIVLADGHMFKTDSSVPEDDVKLLFGYFHANAKVEDIPEELLKYEVEEENVHQRQSEIAKTL